jgi:hypothetical protein
MPLQIIQIQVLHTVLNLSIISTNNKYLVQILVGVPVEDRGEATLWLPHFDFGHLYPLIVDFIIYFNRINPIALRVLASKYKNSLLKRLASIETKRNHNSLKLCSCYVQTCGLLPALFLLVFETTHELRVFNRQTLHVGQWTVAVAGDDVDVPGKRFLLLVADFDGIVIVCLQNIVELVVGRGDAVRWRVEHSNGWSRRIAWDFREHQGLRKISW